MFYHVFIVVQLQLTVDVIVALPVFLSVKDIQRQGEEMEVRL